MISYIYLCLLEDICLCVNVNKVKWITKDELKYLVIYIFTKVQVTIHHYERL